MKKNIFSVPINPYLTDEEFKVTYLPLLVKNLDSINDFYATIRIEPFTQDAMGGIFENETDTLNLAIFYKDLFNKPITAVFNNITVSPDPDTLEIFINNFRPLYERGIHSIIIPFKHWMYTGRLQEEFPLLRIRNTILNNDYKPQEVFNSFKAGFKDVYVDRSVIRDEDTLKRYVEVKRKFTDSRIFLLINERCIGNCPVQDEHFSFNNKRTEKTKPYFANKISKFTCNKWSIEDPAYYLKLADIVPVSSELDRLLNYVDVFKVHGRDNKDKLLSSLRLIDNYNDNRKELRPEVMSWLKKYINNIDDYILQVRNCKLECWDCTKCYDRLK